MKTKRKPFSMIKCCKELKFLQAPVFRAQKLAMIQQNTIAARKQRNKI
jgi:hypothetical protein